MPLHTAPPLSCGKDTNNGTAHSKNVNNCLNTHIYSYLETSGGQSSNLYLKLITLSTRLLIRHLWNDKTKLFPALVSNKCCSIRSRISFFDVYDFQTFLASLLVGCKRVMVGYCFFIDFTIRRPVI